MRVRAYPERRSWGFCNGSDNPTKTNFDRIIDPPILPILEGPLYDKFQRAVLSIH